MKPPNSKPKNPAAVALGKIRTPKKAASSRANAAKATQARIKIEAFTINEVFFTHPLHCMPAFEIPTKIRDIIFQIIDDYGFFISGFDGPYPCRFTVISEDASLIPMIQAGFDISGSKVNVTIGENYSFFSSRNGSESEIVRYVIKDAK